MYVDPYNLTVLSPIVRILHTYTYVRSVYALYVVQNSWI